MAFWVVIVRRIADDACERKGPQTVGNFGVSMPDILTIQVFVSTYGWLARPLD